MDALGSPVDGTLPVHFAFYDATAGGPVLYEVDQNVDFANGYFSTRIDGFDASAFDDDDVYLGIAVDGGAELPQRQHLASVPFAVRSLGAASADTATTADSADVATSVDGGTVDVTQVSINGTTVIDSSGSWVGETIPVDVAGAIASGILSDAAASGSYLDLTDLPVTLEEVGSSCSDGQIPKYSAGAWSCADDDIVYYSGGNGLTLVGSQFVVNYTQAQARITGACGGGEFISGVNQDGTVSCGAPTTYSDTQAEAAALNVMRECFGAYLDSPATWSNTTSNTAWANLVSRKITLPRCTTVVVEAVGHCYNDTNNGLHAQIYADGTEGWHGNEDIGWAMGSIHHHVVGGSWEQCSTRAVFTLDAGTHDIDLRWKDATAGGNTRWNGVLMTTELMGCPP